MTNRLTIPLAADNTRRFAPSLWETAHARLRGLVESIRAIGRRALASYERYRKAKAVRDALRQLDDRMLRDLGFHRDEIDSVAAEFAGRAERTRVERV